MPALDRFLLIALFAAADLAAQDTTRVQPRTPPRDSSRVTTLPGVRTEATRIERQIFDQAPNVGSLSVSGKELAGAPRFFSEADILRAVQLLPGVEARNDFNAGMNVRGGEGDQNLVLLDGYPIYNPFHLGGLFGTFIGPTVGRVDLLTGAFPAAYGNRLSSVLDVRSAEETRNGLHGTANVSLLASTASLGSAIADGRGSWMIAGRRTYIDLATRLLAPDEVPYDFRDLQAHASYAFGNGLRLAITGYAGHDAVSFAESGTAQPDTQAFSWGNRVLGATVGRTLTAPHSIFSVPMADSVALEQRVSISTFDADVRVGNGLITIHAPLRDIRTSGLVASFGAKHTRTLGYEIATQHFAFENNFSAPIFPADSLAQRMASGSVYYDDLWRPMPKVILTAGARFDAVSGRHWRRITPRLSAKYFINDDLAITGGVGEYAQWIRSLAREEVPIRPLDFWVGSGRDWPVSTARHYVLGTEGWLNRNRSFRVEVFLKTYRNLLEPNPVDDAQKDGDEFLFLRGHSYGADFMLRQFQVGRFNGWVAYTFGVSTRVGGDGKTFHPAQDRRHDINLVGSWDYTKYTLGTRVNLATGTPYTYIVGSFETQDYDAFTHGYTGTQSETGFQGTQYIADDRNGARLPLTSRIDLSLTRKGHLFGLPFSTYLSVANAANAQNVFAYSFEYNRLPPKRVKVPQLPIVPTLGFSVAW
jgi:hypothetical protein